jgi:hypothetical protein
MKKNIYTLILSLIISVSTAYHFFQNQWSNCQGCGMAPDGKTWLGPYMSDYISYSLFGVFIFIITFLILYIIIKFINRLSKSTQKLQNK